MAKAWVLVADRGGARIFATTTPAVFDLKAVDEVVWDEGRSHYGDVYSDRSGRFGRDGARGASGDPGTDLAHRSASRLARRLVTELGRARGEGRFDELYVVAAPLMLGELRAAMGKPLAAMIRGEVLRDFANHSNADRVEQVASLVRELAAPDREPPPPRKHIDDLLPQPR